MTDIDPEATTRAAVMLEQLAKAAYRRAAVLREALTGYAIAEHERTHAGVTWRYQDVANVVLPLTEQAAYVDDEAALIEWVQHIQPDQIEQVERIRGAFVKYLLGAVVCEDGIAYLDGEEVPGLKVREGGRPKSLAITPAKAAKELFPQLADEALRQLAAGPLAPVLALPEAPEGGDES